MGWRGEGGVVAYPGHTTLIAFRLLRLKVLKQFGGFHFESFKGFWFVLSSIL